jgi:hypothetical protein
MIVDLHEKNVTRWTDVGQESPENPSLGKILEKVDGPKVGAHLERFTRKGQADLNSERFTNPGSGVRAKILALKLMIAKKIRRKEQILSVSWSRLTLLTRNMSKRNLGLISGQQAT